MPFVAVSSDGSRIVSAGQEGLYSVWDPRNDRVLQLEKNNNRLNAEQTFSGVEFSLVLMAGFSRFSAMEIWRGSHDSQTANPVGKELWHSRGVSLARFGSGNTLTAMTIQGEILVLGLANGGANRFRDPSWPVPKFGKSNILTITTAFLALDRDGTVVRWDCGNNELRPTILGEPGKAITYSLCHDSNLLFSGQLGGDAQLWELTTGERIAGHLPYSPPETGEAPEAAYSLRGKSPLISSDGKWLVTWSASYQISIYRYDGSAPPVLHFSIDQPDDITALCIDASGKWIAFGTAQGNVRFMICTRSSR